MPGLLPKGAETDEEVHLASDLMAKAHCRDYSAGLDWLRTVSAGYPGFRREHVRIVLSGGELIGALRVNMETIRIGEARLRMGGLGFVTTAPHRRGSGVTRALMLDTMRYLEEQRCHVAMLFSVPNFYRRFGFAPTLNEYAIRSAVGTAPAALCGGFRSRPGKPGDIRAIQRIHAANDAETACSIVRNAAHISNRWDRWKDVQVVTNDQGKVLGYFVCRREEEEVIIEETSAAGLGACGAVLQACMRTGADVCVPRLCFRLPPRHPMTQYLLPRKSLHEIRVFRDSGGMMAIINLEETLESMIPEWESRLAQHSAREWREEVTLLIDHVPNRIRTHRGAIDVASSSGKNKVSLSRADMVHLLTGYRYIDDILTTQHRAITANARTLLAVLFPKRTPFVWPLDRF
ncbi:MAG: GNAT family N-acetyltransferase [Candidatus Hydrogenedentes bacterium]|nr:GNAT family N-acetyltransferase [Candidatus Hydrogenedentota bacterium]